MTESTICTLQDKVLSVILDMASPPTTAVTKVLNKGECLEAQAKSMLAISRILEGSSEVRDNLLVARYKIFHAKATIVKISNIKQVVEMGMMSEDDGKLKVVDLLGVKWGTT